jgi:hypothetical protein
MKFAGNFSAAFAARGRVDWRARLEEGKGRSFVVQDKGTAVRYGIFGLFPNELAAFSPRSQS